MRNLFRIFLLALAVTSAALVAGCVMDIEKVWKPAKNSVNNPYKQQYTYTGPVPVAPWREAYTGGNYETAFKLLKPVAERGDPDALLKLGEMYEDGEGVSRNLDEAIQHYRLVPAGIMVGLRTFRSS